MSSVAIGFGIAVVLLIIANFRIRTGSPEAGMTLTYWSVIPMLYGGIFLGVLLYKSWATI